MFWKILITIVALTIGFGGIFLWVSWPYGVPQKIARVVWAFFKNAKAHAHNFFSVVRLIAHKKRLRPVYRRYPKTTDFVICSFFFLVAIIIATVVAVADLFSG